jgi:hypothetical protein
MAGSIEAAGCPGTGGMARFLVYRGNPGKIPVWMNSYKSAILESW